jgi:hypothetical protein
MLRRVPILACEAVRDCAEAGHSEPQSDETIKKANELKLILNRLIQLIPGEALHEQSRLPRFRKNNSTPLVYVFPARIIVGHNPAGQQTYQVLVQLGLRRQYQSPTEPRAVATGSKTQQPVNLAELNLGSGCYPRFRKGVALQGFRQC